MFISTLCFNETYNKYNESRTLVNIYSIKCIIPEYNDKIYPFNSRINLGNNVWIYSIDSVDDLRLKIDKVKSGSQE